MTVNSVRSGLGLSGFRRSTGYLWDTVRSECSFSNGDMYFNNVMNCMKWKTFRLKETILFDKTTPPSNQWKEDISITYFGRCGGDVMY